MISSPLPSASVLKNLQLNPKTNTGHIETIKHAPKRYNSQLLDAPKNIENSEELVNLQSDYLLPPSALFLKNPQLNFEANTGHIKEIKHAPERYDL